MSMYNLKQNKRSVFNFVQYICRTRGSVLCHSRQHSIVLVSTQEAVFRLDITEQLFKGALGVRHKYKNDKKKKKKKKKKLKKKKKKIYLKN